MDDSSTLTSRSCSHWYSRIVVAVVDALVVVVGVSAVFEYRSPRSPPPHTQHASDAVSPANL